MIIDVLLKTKFTNRYYSRIFPFTFFNNEIKECSLYGTQKRNGYFFGLIYSRVTNCIYLIYNKAKRC